MNVLRVKTGRRRRNDFGPVTADFNHGETTFGESSRTQSEQTISAIKSRCRSDAVGTEPAAALPLVIHGLASQ